jgi:uncharacterized protein
LIHLVIRSHRVIYKSARSLRAQESFKRARFFYLRSLTNPRQSARWLRFLGEQAQAFGFTTLDSTLLRKHTRSYGVNSWNKREQVDAAIAHYRIISHLMSAHRLRALLSGEKIPLATLNGRKSSYLLYASAPLTTFREGEIKLTCATSEGEPLATLTFCLFDDDVITRSLLIGGLQGPPSPTAKRAIITATRDLYGMRPKQVVFEVAQTIAQLAGCQKLVAVSNKTHISGAKLKSDYDSFWIERGGMFDRRYGFRFPQSALNRTRHLLVGPGREAVKADLFTAAEQLLDRLPRQMLQACAS